MASACEKCHYFICRCGEHEELKALRAENEQLKKLLAEVKADIETAELGEGYEYNLRLILDKIKALKG